MIERATEAMRDSPFLEFRLDYLEKPLAALPKLQEFLAENTMVTAIATCRRAANGGKFKGTVATELEVLQKAGASGFHLVDLELETAEAIKASELDKLRERGTALHDGREVHPERARAEQHESERWAESDNGSHDTTK